MAIGDDDARTGFDVIDNEPDAPYEVRFSKERETGNTKQNKQATRKARLVSFFSHGAKMPVRYAVRRESGLSV